MAVASWRVLATTKTTGKEELLAFRSDGESLAFVSDGRSRFWTISSPTVIEGPEVPLSYSIAVSADLQLVATEIPDHRVAIEELGGSRRRQTLSLAESSGFAFAPYVSTYALVEASAPTIRIVDPWSGRRLASIDAGLVRLEGSARDGTIVYRRFKHDLRAAEGDIALWNPRSGAVRTVASASSAAIAPDGRVLVLSSVRKVRPRSVLRIRTSRPRGQRRTTDLSLDRASSGHGISAWAQVGWNGQRHSRTRRQIRPRPGDSARSALRNIPLPSRTPQWSSDVTTTRRFTWPTD